MYFQILKTSIGVPWLPGAPRNTFDLNMKQITTTQFFLTLVTCECLGAFNLIFRFCNMPMWRKHWKLNLTCISTKIVRHYLWIIAFFCISKDHILHQQLQTQSPPRKSAQQYTIWRNVPLIKCVSVVVIYMFHCRNKLQWDDILVTS